jgi:hypothetical protein
MFSEHKNTTDTFTNNLYSVDIDYGVLDETRFLGKDWSSSPIGSSSNTTVLCSHCDKPCAMFYGFAQVDITQLINY